jgi:hypothetical protein
MEMAEIWQREALEQPESFFFLRIRLAPKTETESAEQRQKVRRGETPFFELYWPKEMLVAWTLWSVGI